MILKSKLLKASFTKIVIISFACVILGCLNNIKTELTSENTHQPKIKFIKNQIFAAKYNFNELIKIPITDEITKTFVIYDKYGNELARFIHFGDAIYDEKGNIKEVIIKNNQEEIINKYEFSYMDDDSVLEINEYDFIDSNFEYRSKKIMRFNRKNNKFIENAEFKPNGELESIIKYTYGKNNKLIQETTSSENIPHILSNEKVNQMSIKKWEFDDCNNIIYFEDIWPNNFVASKDSYTYTYGEDCLPIIAVERKFDGSSTTSEYEYNEKKQLIKKTVKSTGSLVQYFTEYKYDSFNNIIETSSFDNRDNTMSTYQFKYDSYGKIVWELYLLNNIPKTITETQYSYY